MSVPHGSLCANSASAKTPSRASTARYFLNGIPIFTAELKNPLTGQEAEDAIRQYRNDRPPHKAISTIGASPDASRTQRL